MPRVPRLGPVPARPPANTDHGQTLESRRTDNRPAHGGKVVALANRLKGGRHGRVGIGLALPRLATACAACERRKQGRMLRKAHANRIESARCTSRTRASVVSQSMQPSVMETPRRSLPTGCGKGWLPGPRLLSIMAPMMDLLPAET